jgi:primosomal protein N' (replication factor Y)
VNLLPIQQGASEAIVRSVAEKKTSLYHGITGSGNRVYVDIIRKIAEQRLSGVIPPFKIALTTQIVLTGYKKRIFFGNKMGVYHSNSPIMNAWRYGRREGRYPDLWLGGAFSGILPMENLGLIIVDEEHETSYKQFDPHPATTPAMLRLWCSATKSQSAGSAAPSMESYCTAQRVATV